MGIDLGLDLDKIFEQIFVSTNMGLIAGGVALASFGFNYYLYNQIKDYGTMQEEYEKIFAILEPILTKIIDKQELANSDIEDIKSIRNKIKFDIIKR